jgi:3-oxoacyl-[acyl-carrier-protein] synthase-3
LALAKGLIAGGIAKKVLLITAETYSKFINFKDKSNRTIFGDAASASIISTDAQGGEIANFSLGTDGSGAENLIVKNGGIRNRYESSADVVSEDGAVRNDNNLYMNGPEIFKFTSQAVPVLVDDTLVKNDLQLDDINLFIFHQANQFMLDYIRKKINIPSERFHIFMEKCGNTVSSTIPIALHNAINNNAINIGEKLLLAGFGVGYSWGGVVLKY